MPSKKWPATIYIVRLEHAVELARLFPHGRLLVLAGGHGDYLGEAVVTTAESEGVEQLVDAVHPEDALAVLQQAVEEGDEP